MNVNVATVKNHFTMVNVHYVFLAKLDYLPVLMLIINSYHFSAIYIMVLEYASSPIEKRCSTRI